MSDHTIPDGLTLDSDGHIHAVGGGMVLTYSLAVPDMRRLAADLVAMADRLAAAGLDQPAPLDIPVLHGAMQ
jgi:hypothetical protein